MSLRSFRFAASHASFSRDACFHLQFTENISSALTLTVSVSEDSHHTQDIKNHFQESFIRQLQENLHWQLELNNKRKQEPKTQPIQHNICTLTTGKTTITCNKALVQSPFTTSDQETEWVCSCRPILVFKFILVFIFISFLGNRFYFYIILYRCIHFYFSFYSVSCGSF